jgi:hypothetical protein
VTRGSSVAIETGRWGLEILVVLALSEAGIFEVFTWFHLLELLFLVALLNARHLVKAAFGLFRGVINEFFDSLTFVTKRWYRFRRETAEARNEYRAQVR